MSRRASRLRTEPPDRGPVLIAGALVVGLVIGLVTVPRLFTGMDSRAESYVVLASTLYAQGENPSLLRDRLMSVGIAQPASTVLGMAQRYGASRDRKQQQQAEALEAFGKVLLNPEAAASPTPRAIEPPQPSPTIVLPPSTAPSSGPAPTSSPAATRVAPAGVSVPVPTTSSSTSSVQPVSTATAAVVAPSPTAGTIQRGRIKPPDGGSARLRRDPSQEGGTLALIPNNAQIEILESVRGQPIEGESRWLRVRYGSFTGYLWSKLVAVGD